MAARLDSVAKFICELGEWEVTPLQLQKLLYLSQMMYMGRNNGERLVDTSFEAWDYGPVSPKLYRKVRMFGSQPVDDVFFEARRFKSTDQRRLLLEEVCPDLIQKTPGQLVEITHWEQGAWAKHYVAGERGIVIPDRDIAREYDNRLAA